MVLLGAFPVLPIKFKCHLCASLRTLLDFPGGCFTYYEHLPVISRGFIRTELCCFHQPFPSHTLPPKLSATHRRVKIYVN